VALAAVQAAQNPVDSNGYSAGTKAAIIGGVVGGAVMLGIAVVAWFLIAHRTTEAAATAALVHVHAPAAGPVV